ncbi:Ubiquinone/menaquinone biosynthesis C-methylase UbiE [Halobacillus alkaliphilus]|uniref:Ubiquinone/menaquinone biosynthesis C-methylase UbiE n=1 Tax=Halobacillus alkaliphilus TaxID=396056 RepID=A0A1I2TU76_9BACI|nr:class I SAM-dependent methyltransferase [Halobacillus alkaliphilus]SFG68430.1 Ubiquinone/menaquinone biosynthesis C-methylase UbiE [Halobacillus alkaliphilus]
MKETDFSTIADHYDNNQYRVEEIEKDTTLKSYMNQHQKEQYEVLDLSCGTGLYLAKQVPLFQDEQVRWTGLDASKAMLEKAKEKLGSIQWVQGYAENMPFESDKFDYIINNYSFHHYKEKEKVLDEITRVLMPSGQFKMHNIAIHSMPKWWVYHYFPQAYAEDVQRFWHPEKIYEELRKRDFEVQLKVNDRHEEILTADYLPYAENRDISVLTLISDSEYEKGLNKMKQEVKEDPLKTIPHEFAELFITAKKR